MDKNTTVNIVLEESDVLLVKKIAKDKGLGGKGFSAAIRIIIREWDAAQEAKAKQSKEKERVNQ